MKEATSGDLPAWKNAAPRYLGRMLQFTAAWALISGIVSYLSPPIYTAVTTALTYLNLPSDFSVFNAVLLFILAGAVRHRRRIALWAVIIYFQLAAVALSVLFIVLYEKGDFNFDTEGASAISLGPYIVIIAVGLVLSVVLFLTRKAFPTRVESGTWWRAIAVVAAGVASAILVGFILSEVAYRHTGSAPSRLGAITTEALGKLGYILPVHGTFLGLPQENGYWVSVTVSLMTIAGLFAAFTLFVRSAHRELYSSMDDELRVRRLLLRFGHNDSLGYFNTRRDKSLVFSEDGQAAVAYRLVGSVLLASGDPIGDRASWQDAITAWLAMARRHGWTPAATGTTPEGTSVYRRQGLQSVLLGDEAVVAVEDFALGAPGLREVQRAVRRAENAGYTVTVRRQHDIPAKELAMLAELGDTWRHGGPERGFSMALGRFADPTDTRTMVVVASDGEGHPQGLLSFVPWGARGLSLDLMRRGPQAVNGVTTYMIASLIEECREQGIREVGLNFAVMRRVFETGEKIEASSRQRAVRRIMVFFSRWWQLESLYRSNEIYLPQWRPRMLCYGKGSSLVEVLVAMGRAEGFVPENAVTRAMGKLYHRQTRQGLDEETGRVSPEFTAAVLADEDAASVDTSHVFLPRLTAYVKARRDALDALRGHGIDPYPVDVERTDTVENVISRYEEGLAADTVTDDESAVCGRVIRIRHHGGLCFADIREGSREIQAMLSRRAIDEAAVSNKRPETFAVWKQCVSRGDIIAVHGHVITTHTGQLTIAADRWHMASKSLQPMPDKRLGVTDPETKLRKREVDIATSSAAYDMVIGRAAILTSIRDCFRARGYIEVETPMLQAVHGGANARPFHTHSNAYDIDLSLRIAPELALKRLLVGGVDKIFEMGRNFRNEGTSFKHNPEFTSIEAYEFFTDYTYQRELTREVIVNAAMALHGRPVAIRPDGTELDISGPWPAIPIHQAVSQATGHTVTSETSRESIRDVYASLGITPDTHATSGELVMDLYDRYVEGQTDAPTFYTDIPVEVSPLVRPHRGDPRLTEKWDLVVFGLELGTGSTELIDPVDQRNRFTEQSLKAAAGDPEAMEVDESFLQALEFGLRPLGGLGIGVDRLVMILTGTTIRQTLAFPFMKPR